jgi:diguanylate cyclase (GGDEF)-like protein
MDGQADSRYGRDGCASGDTVSGTIARPLDQRRALYAERAAADADQDAADADQTASDADETASERDAADAERDQRASDQDQASADRQQSADADAATLAAYEVSRIAREASTVSRLATHADRATTARARAESGAERDITAIRRDETARRRDLRAEVIERSIAASDAPLAEQLEQLRTRAAADRARAADDRARAARDRAAAARERVRLEAELRSAHLDELTGAFRREAGELALTHEIERARRGDGRFVVAFVDVDGMKRVNDRDGHAAGDRVLQSLVWAMRSQLRSYDPIVRFGGDEFVVGLGGVDLGDVERRFAAIDRLVRHDVGVGVSVGLATLGGDETLDQLTGMADDALLHAKKRRGAARVRRTNDASGVTAPAARNGSPSPMVVSEPLSMSRLPSPAPSTGLARQPTRGSQLTETPQQ